MEIPEDPIDSVIEEIATLLATGYLRLRKARTLNESAAPSGLQEAGEPPDRAPGPSAQVAMSPSPRKKGNLGFIAKIRTESAEAHR